ncbi:hypothetical protein ACFFJT_16955 [Dyella flava]|uniref:DUF2884 family protein n=1 Tax=Dyella flava TaxID=1920170 RepID=A0ABS2K3Q2_9GAMM|nr:hypothetical protein [Dyella flava]MBM7125784.1 hypothetical protein [Dyella flava]GLQ48698.1 hypothetical protein GCM10010872_01470 [Dyella flava]
MKYATALGMLTLCSVLAACGNDSDRHSITRGTDIHLSSGSIRSENGQISLSISEAPDATISAQGELTINQQAVAVDPASRDLLKSYYQNAIAVHADGMATAKAGEDVGEQALESVKQAINSGHSDQIQQQIEAKAQVLKETALKVCQDLGNIQSAQDQLATQLPAFKPYGHMVTADDVSDCRNDIHVR